MANPRKNEVIVNWEKKNERKTTYFKNYNGKRLSFIGTADTIKEAKEIKNFRKKRYGRITKIIKLGKEYLLYSH